MNDLTSHEIKHNPDVEKNLFVDIGCDLMVGVPNLREAAIAGEVCGHVGDMDNLTSHEVKQVGGTSISGEVCGHVGDMDKLTSHEVKQVGGWQSLEKCTVMSGT